MSSLSKTLLAQSSSLQADKKSFLFFLVLVVLTASHFVFLTDKPMVLGVLAVTWGLFGLFRLIYLNHYQMDEIPKIITLPVQILFGAGQKQQEKRSLIIRRMAQPDVIIWLSLSMLFTVFALYNSLYPTNTSAQGAFDVSSMRGVNLPLSISVDPYTILLEVSYLGVLATLVFLSLSYSQKRRQVNLGLMLLVPLSAFGILKIISTGIYTSYVLWPDIMYLTGVGLNYDQTQFLMTSVDLMGSATSFVTRFVALGSIGAYGVYLIGLPAVVMLFKTLINPSRSYIRPIVGLLGLLVLTVIDISILPSMWTSALSVILICIVALCWGSTVRFR